MGLVCIGSKILLVFDAFLFVLVQLALDVIPSRPFDVWMLQRVLCFISVIMRFINVFYY